MKLSKTLILFMQFTEVKANIMRDLKVRGNQAGDIANVQKGPSSY